MPVFFCDVPRRLSGAVLLFAVCTLLLGCAARQDSASAPRLPYDLPGGFAAFYEQFHKDSLFQMERITWPLAGQTGVSIDSNTVEVADVEWMPETWRMHRPADLDSGDYTQDFQMVGDFMVIERITTKVGNFGVERRFAHYGDGRWELIYYADLVGGRQ